MSFVNYNAANFSNPDGIRRQRPVETSEFIAIEAQTPSLTENVTIISDDSDNNIDVISLCESEDTRTEYSYASSTEIAITDIDEDEQISYDLYAVENEVDTETTRVIEAHIDQSQVISPENDIIIRQTEEEH